VGFFIFRPNDKTKNKKNFAHTKSLFLNYCGEVRKVTKFLIKKN
jgi:hypothetical protein